MKNFLFLILLLAGCDKEFVEPPMTTNERFYCEIDGKIFRPRNNGDIFNSVLYTDYFLSPKGIAIYAFNAISGSSEKSVILFNSFPNNKLVIQKINFDGKNAHASFNNGYIGKLSKSDYYKSINGFVNYSIIDTLNRKISGTFEFDAKSVLDTTKIIKIRKGNFNNLKY